MEDTICRGKQKGQRMHCEKAQEGSASPSNSGRECEYESGGAATPLELTRSKFDACKPARDPINAMCNTVDARVYEPDLKR